MRNYNFLALLAILTSSLNCVLGQSDVPKEPPSEQNTYYFSIQEFDRQPEPPKYIMDGIRSLSSKPKSSWSKKDSLFFAYKQVHLEDFGMALNIFLRLNTDTIRDPHALKLYHASLYKNLRFESLKELKYYTIVEGVFEIQSKRELRKRILDINVMKMNKQWSSEDSLIFPILKDSSVIALRKSRTDTKQKLVPLIKNMDEVLRVFVFLHDDRDAVLSQAYQELSDFQYEHFYISNAYLYNRIALYYDKNNKRAIESSNRLKDEMSDRNYLFPSFRTTFGKIISNRYHLKEIKEAQENTDNTLRVQKGNELDKPEKEVKKDYLPWLDGDLIIVIGLFVLLFLVMILLKPIKSND